jgi:hypothetical protein
VHRTSPTRATAGQQSGAPLRGVYVTESLKAVLAAYPSTPHPTDGLLPRLSPADVAHLKRWADDERADEVWNTIDSAAKERGMLFPARLFIQELLGARDIAESINHRRKHRDLYRKYAAQMERDAKTLRQRLANGLTLIPNGDKLAQRLDEAARTYRGYAAVSWNLPGVIKWTRESRPRHVFTSQLSNNLFYQYLTYSPIICRLAREVYALVGAEREINLND